ncbi:MAG TPA: SHOCT domain-containing protein [Cytophagaceae bacterium]
MQVKQITVLPTTPVDAERKPVTEEKLQNEYDYFRSLKLLQKMLDVGLITKEEFEKIDRRNRQSFSPFGVELMP